MQTLDSTLLTRKEYHKYIEEECRRQWHECQETKYGIWDAQSDDEKAEYYNDLYDQQIDLLGAACCDCRYCGCQFDTQKGETFTCQCIRSEAYGKEVKNRNYCDEFQDA